MFGMRVVGSIKVLITVILAIIGISLLAVPAYADPVCGAIPDQICQDALNATPTQQNPIGGLSNVIDWAINIATGLFVAAVVLVLVISGVQISASAGNPEAIKSAKTHIFNAVLGLALLISFRLIFSLFGVFDTGVTAPVTLFQGVNTSDINSVQKIIINAISLASLASGIVSVIFIIVGAIRYISSGGNSGAIEGAKKTITYAIGGMVLSIMAYGIVSFIVSNIK